jgi:hypothetical protein
MSRPLESPPVRHLIATGGLASGASYTPGSLENTEYQLYVPFNSLLVKNLSKQLLELEYGNDRITTIPAGAIIELQEPGIIGYKVTNIDTAVNSAPIEIIMQRVIRDKHIALANLWNMRICDILDGKGPGGC